MYERYVVAAILLAVLALLATERLRYDIVALLGLAALGVAGVLSSQELAAGFGNPALITVATMSIMSRAFQKTALLRRLAYYLGKAGRQPILLVCAGTLLVSILSAFMNNVAAISLAIPIMTGVARRYQLPLSKLMMPLAFGSLVGGTATLIGSPPNLLASGFLQAWGFTPLGFFELTGLGVALILVTTLYFATIGYHLLPSGRVPRDLELEYSVTDYIAEVAVTPQCRVAGMTIAETPMSRLYDANILSIVRGGVRILAPPPHQRLLAGDILQLEVSRENLVAMAGNLGIKVLPKEAEVELRLDPGRSQTCDAVVSADSPLVGRTLKELDFRRKYGLSVLAIKRRGQSFHHRIADLRMSGGDVLLLLGPPRAHSEACDPLGLVLLGQAPVTGTRADYPVLFAFAGLIVAVASGLLSMVTAGILAAVIIGLTRVLSLQELYDAVPWPVLILLGSMFGLAAAAEQVGMSGLLASAILSLTRGNPGLSLAVLFALTSGLTAVLVNSAAFMLVAPVSLALAAGLGADPRAFLIITVAGSASAFFSPVGHQSNALVYGVGGYRFADYARAGVGLSLLVGATCLYLVPRFWPLFP
ncbi:MAG: SLC13 family permease [Bacillota bacterium]